MSTTTTIGLIQFTASADPDLNRATALSMTEAAADSGARLVLPHELVATQYFPAFPISDTYFDLAEPVDGPTVTAFRELAARRGIAVLVPWFERAGSGRYFNTAAFVDEHGDILGLWRKVHIPRVQVPAGNGTIEVDEKYYFEEGHEQYGVVDWNGVAVGVLICHDRHFPEAARALALQGADLLLVPSTSRGIPDSADPVATWRTELGAMAIQNCLFVAATNRTGLEGEQVFMGASLVVHPGGDELSRLGAEPGIDVIEIEPAAAERVRRARGFFRDRRPDLYGAIVERDAATASARVRPASGADVAGASR
ncbi:carbon-nitrogen hydrolase family protein [Naasia lichenicola]|uniref:N-carbamoylputrescine amidase n=1 Tax=Naasia lichenicola TaxID=2565933 RepID=A0A4S4FUJ9_9MICO|nr:nitrilase-related carbon-nitrogen hydrolase [Naasia lichenicola]THG33286.1 N-carbamoylputrescine amidase [Naasia lichenicola]